ncbi:hypothetical protein H6F78_17785 [Coleofasciculus sp. FACHB-64]|nr:MULTISPECIES: hypothetical protein [unclassified Coleofasciculus]MBD2047421.1 hypothetical protein [Coleofasciculus sp. FACHB-64]
MIVVNMPYFQGLTILADLPPSPGYTRGFSYCVKITNQEKYPDYWLFLQISSVNPHARPSPYILIQPGECVPVIGYRPIATISAIAKNKVQPKDLENSSEVWSLFSKSTILQNINLQNALIKGTPTIQPPSQLPVIYSKVEDNFQVKSLNLDGLQLSLVKQDRQLLPLTWLVFPVMGIAILGWIIIFRRRKK